MNVSKSSPPESEESWRLPVALIAASALIVVAALLTPTTGAVEAFVVLGRPLVFGVLAWLAFRRRTWARWLLIAWLTYGVIFVVSNLLAGHRPNVAVVLTIVVFIWACLELGIAIATGRNSKSEWLA